MAETRFLFWDGICNVDEAGLDASIACNPTLLDEAEDQDASPPEVHAFKPVFIEGDPPEVATATLVVPSVGVRIRSVDAWFVPVTDLLAIELDMSCVAGIRSLLLRVQTHRGESGFRTVYQEILKKDVVQSLSTTDKSTDESQADKDSRADRLKAHRARIVPPLTHCRVQVWVSNQENAFQRGDSDIDPFAPVDEAYDPAGIIVVGDQFFPAPAGELPDEATSAEAVVHRVKTQWDGLRQPRGLQDFGHTDCLAGSPLVEAIMAGKAKGLTVSDREPDHEMSSGHQGNPDLQFPGFRESIKRALYEVCIHSKIGTALIRSISELEDKPVQLHPAATYYFQGAGGLAINEEYKDDATIEAAVEEVALKLADEKKHTDVGDSVVDEWWSDELGRRKAEQEEYDKEYEKAKARYDAALKAQEKAAAESATGSQDNSAESAGSGPPPPPPSGPPGIPPPFGAPRGAGAGRAPTRKTVKARSIPSAIVKYASRRHIYDKIGATGGSGSAAHFYFNVDKMKDFDEDRYPNPHHVADPAKGIEVDFEGKTRKISWAKPSERSGKQFSVETPFFVAFLHEMVHAHRIQLGMNAEPDRIEGDLRRSTYHPHSLLERLKANQADPNVAILARNLISRYVNEAREEYDTVEGEGVPVDLSQEPEARAVAQAKNIPLEDDKVAVHENTIRTELGLDLRYRYLPGNTDADGQTNDGSAVDTHRKFIKSGGRLAPLPPNLETPSLDQISDEVQELITECGTARPRIPLVANQNYFNFEPLRMALAYKFGSMVAVPFSRMAHEDRNLVTQVWTSLKNSQDSIVEGLEEADRMVVNDLLDRDLLDDKPASVLFQSHLADLLDVGKTLRKNFYHKPPPGHAGNATDEGYGSYDLTITRPAVGPHQVQFTLPNKEVYTTPPAKPGQLAERELRSVDELATPAGAQEVAVRNLLYNIFLDQANEGKRVILSQLLRASMRLDPIVRQRIVAASDDLSGAMNMCPQAMAGWNIMGDFPIQRGGDLASADDPSYTCMVLKDSYYPDAAELVQTLIHEPMHMYSYGRQGMMAWDPTKLTANVPAADVFRIGNAFDEGTTEMFARIVTYRLNAKAGKEVSKPVVKMGYPYYEFLVQVVVQLVRDIDTKRGEGNGLQILGQAYYSGKHDELNAVLDELADDAAYGGRYTQEYFQHVAKLELDGTHFKGGSPSGKAVDALKGSFGVDIDGADELFDRVADGSWVDRVLKTGNGDGKPVAPISEQPTPADKPTPIAIGPVTIDCACCEDPVPIPDVVLKSIA